MSIDIVQAVKDSVSKHQLCWAHETLETKDDVFSEKNGVPTFLIAERLCVSSKEARRRLNLAHKKGLIHKSKRKVGVNLCWWPEGFLSEIKSSYEVFNGSLVKSG